MVLKAEHRKDLVSELVVLAEVLELLPRRSSTLVLMIATSLIHRHGSPQG